MPFGQVFASLFFGVVCGWGAIRLIAQPALPTRVAGLFLLALGLSVALGMLTRRAWARGVGAAAAVAVGALAAQQIFATGGGPADHAMLLGGFGCLILLAVPATGRAEGEAARTGEPLRWVASLALVGVVGSIAVGMTSERGEATATASRGELPASAAFRQIRWTDFEAGSERARAEGRPMMVTFVTDWCGYCRKMAKNTWRARPVIDRMDEFVAVKVVGDDRATGGAQLARRFGVQGFPANFLVDSEGQVLARRDGYLGPTQFLSWVDQVVGPPAS